MSKGAADIFKEIIKEIVNGDFIKQENELANKETYKKPFTEFISLIYKTVTMSEEKIPFAKLEDNDYKEIKGEFVELCKYYSFNKFTDWMKKTNTFSELYYIHDTSGEDKKKQITFYCRVMKLMYRIFIDTHENCDDKKVKNSYERLVNLYELLKEETILRCIEPNKNELDENEPDYSGYTDDELIKKYNSLKNVEEVKRETNVYIDIITEELDILSELKCRDNLPDYKKKEYSEIYKELNDKRIKLTIKNINPNMKSKKLERKKLEGHIKSNIKLDMYMYDPIYIELVDRCRRKYKENKEANLDSIIDEMESQINKEQLSIYSIPQ